MSGGSGSTPTPLERVNFVVGFAERHRVREKPAAATDDDSGSSEGVASPYTPLAFPEDGEHDEATEAAAAKACAQDKVSRRAARSAPTPAHPFRLNFDFLLLDGRSWAAPAAEDPRGPASREARRGDR
ncbi:hypothetical protein ZWY2020_042353 [Hordeum vulgare]|nr:hypothetical protein ZWY2020_042353 [Hordeum vulgare]